MGGTRSTAVCAVILAIAAVLGSIQPQPLAMADDGTIPLMLVRGAIKPDDFHFARTQLLCLENTSAGRVLPMDYLRAASELAVTHKLGRHLDGARHDLLQHLVLGAEGDHLAVPDHHQLVEHGNGARAVGDDDHRAAALPHRGHGLDERRLAFRIEIGVGLVEHQQGGRAVEIAALVGLLHEGGVAREHGADPPRQREPVGGEHLRHRDLEPAADRVLFTIHRACEITIDNDGCDIGRVVLRSEPSAADHLKLHDVREAVSHIIVRQEHAFAFDLPDSFAR